MYQRQPADEAKIMRLLEIKTNPHKDGNTGQYLYLFSYLGCSEL